ncbi:MAG: TetR/AcrR family transcriptional regulator [Candidatus Binatia bacterium]|nr:TetR/AcrR family transcriptional regulator [Candidatus Binatia bacterium]
MKKKTTRTEPTTRRVRRTAAEARTLILDAAEGRLKAGGPEAIRLQDIAADVGISHPTILHHFESRDGLTRALGLRITERLVGDLVDALSAAPANESSAEHIIEHVFSTLGDSGTARLIAWRALSSESRTEARALLDHVADLLHRRRCEHAETNGLKPPTREDSFFIARLAAAAVLGDSLTGGIWNAGTPEHSQVDARFRRWFAHLLMEHVDKG